MARLTFESVKQYASEHGYTLERVKTGYSLNGLIAIDHPTSKAGLALSNLQNVLRVINEGYLLDGQFSIVDWNLEIEESEIVSFCEKYHTHCSYPDIHDQPLPQYCGLVFNDQFSFYELTQIYCKHKGDSRLAIPEMVRYCTEKSIFLVVKPLLVPTENKEIQKCIYPNCENPCFIECDGLDLIKITAYSVGDFWEIYEYAQEVAQKCGLHLGQKRDGRFLTGFPNHEYVNLLNEHGYELIFETSSLEDTDIGESKEIEADLEDESSLDDICDLLEFLNKDDEDKEDYLEKEDYPEKSHHSYKTTAYPQKISQPSIIDNGMLNIGITVIDTYQESPMDIEKYLHCETTKQRVIDICNESRLGHISRDSSRFDISHTILRILRNNSEKYLKWHLSVNCSKTELSDQQFWNLALEVLVS